jgi:hypothetical protein
MDISYNLWYNTETGGHMDRLESHHIFAITIGFFALCMAFIVVKEAIADHVPGGGVPDGCDIGTPYAVFKDRSNGKDTVLYTLICEETR